MKRLLNSRVNRTPVSLSALARLAGRTSNAKTAESGKDLVFATTGTVTNDVRQLELPALNVCAVRFTEEARRRITEAGGNCITFDTLAINRPKGENVVLIRGTRDREAKKHFGKAPGTPGSTAKPYVRSKGRKFEQARGKRKSRGFRV